MNDVKYCSSQTICLTGCEGSFDSAASSTTSLGLMRTNSSLSVAVVTLFAKNSPVETSIHANPTESSGVS